MLRHHAPFRAYVRDVPIVAMTASAIQGDQEKCKKAGMDDYMAKPVKAKLLERMLVRWSLNKRSGPTPQPSSEASECSHESDHCTNAVIPCVGIEDYDGFEAKPEPEPQAKANPKPEAAEAGESRSSILTPRPKPSPLVISQSLSAPDPPARGDLPQAMRLESDELAQQGRDDKLIDAAGVPPPGVPSLHTPLSEKGDSLTEANVQKFEREEELRRRKMS